MPIARPRSQSWQAPARLGDTRNGSESKLDLLAPPVDDLMRALVRNATLPFQVRLRAVGNMAGADRTPRSGI